MLWILSVRPGNSDRNGAFANWLENKPLFSMMDQGGVRMDEVFYVNIKSVFFCVWGKQTAHEEGQNSACHWSGK